MLALMALLVGILTGVGLFMMLRRSMVDLVFGLILISHAANLTVFLSGGLVRGAPPLLTAVPPELPMADPLPQALVLTALVISLAVVAFALVLVARLSRQIQTDDSETLR